jgi:hypothetical protein
MFCPHKNSYLQLVCAMDPRVINKAVDRAMLDRPLDPHTGKEIIKYDYSYFSINKIDGPAVSALSEQSRKLSNVRKGRFSDE